MRPDGRDGDIMGSRGAKNKGKPATKTTTTAGGWTTPGRFDERGTPKDEQSFLVPAESKGEAVRQAVARVRSTNAAYLKAQAAFFDAPDGPGKVKLQRAYLKAQKAHDEALEARDKAMRKRRA